MPLQTGAYRRGEWRSGQRTAGKAPSTGEGAFIPLEMGRLGRVLGRDVTSSARCFNSVGF